jgi:hypothetical protein
VRRDTRAGYKRAVSSRTFHHHAEELPIRLAHRVKELDELPHNLNKMPSIEKVKKWYAESFEVRRYRRATGRGERGS